MKGNSVMDDNYKRFEEKLDKVDLSLKEIGQTLVRQEENLKEHMRRTAIAEMNIEDLRQTDEDFRTEFSSKLDIEIKPFKAHIAFVKGAVWALGIIGATFVALEQSGILKKFF